MNRRDWLLSAAVFAVAFGFLWLGHANRLIPTNDEGIYLDAGQRIVEGQKPYVDFWAYMTPGSLWTQTLAFRIAGVTHRGGRLPVIFFFALQCATIFALATLLASRLAGALAALFYFAFTGANASLLTAQHRWDSGALALLGILLLTAGSGRPLWLAASGVVMSYATITTPSMGVLTAVTAAWLLAGRDRRRMTPWFVGGGVAILMAALVAAYFGGYLGGLFEQIRWLSRKYSAVNRMPYGSIIGGYAALFAGLSSAEKLVNAVLLLFITLPATLPILAGAGWGTVLLRGAVRRDDLAYLVLCLPCLAATTYPRSDIEHLAFVAPLAWVLTAALPYPPKLARALVLFVGFGAAVFLWIAWSPLGRDRWIDTPVGRLRSLPSEEPQLRRLLEVVRPGDSLYVHPYQPRLYFLTQAKNPTRYSYLAPGMMDAEDERVALAALAGHPPKWVLFLELNLEEFRRVFPAGDPSRMRFQSIEAWIRDRYRPTEVVIGGYVLWGHE